MLTIILFLLGLCFGSFLNALTWRIYHKKDWVKGRSQCEYCAHQLAARDLVPVFSWLLLRGHCRYCQKKISWQHPAIELATGALFASLYSFWPHELHDGGQITLLVASLLTSIGLMALLVYDFRWMLLPNKVVYPTALIAAAGRAVYILAFSDEKLHAGLQWMLSIAVASGIFWILHTVSNGKWIGYGDVRLGIVTGTLLASPLKSLLMILLASLIGTLFVLPALIAGKTKLTAKLPYGPFLIMATWIILLFGDSLIDWYKNLIIY